MCEQGLQVCTQITYVTQFKQGYKFFSVLALALM